MASASIAMILGTVAAVCTSVAFVPQIRKIFKTGGQDVSYLMLALYLTGGSLWLVYGLTIRAAAVIWANGVSMALVAICIVLKRIRDREVRPAEGRGRRKLRIAIDMDETIANSLKEHLCRYNAAFGGNLTAEGLQGMELEDAVPPGRRAAVRRMAQEGSFYEDLELIDGARETIQDLTLEHEVFIVSAAMEVPESFAAKHRWLHRHFPFIPASNVVFCGDKEIIDADYLIDDRARHFRGFRGTGILFAAPHNAKESRYLRVESWEDIRRLFLNERPAPERPHAHGIRLGFRAAEMGSGPTP